MKEVKVNVPELLIKVNENRQKHVTEHADAMEGYLEQIVSELSKALKVARTKGIEVDLQPISVLANSKPQSYVKDYDRAISMLEMSEDTVVILTSHEFDQLVMDNWNWKMGFEISASAYSKKLK